MKNHAICVSSWQELKTVHEKAVEIFGQLVTPIIPSLINSNEAFFVAPDGSKEGWDLSNEHDHKRDEFIAYLETLKYEDGSNAFRYAEVFFGEDNGYSNVERHN